MSRHPFFMELGSGLREICLRAELCTFAPMDAITINGDEADSCFFLIGGSVAITMQKDLSLGDGRDGVGARGPRRSSLHNRRGQNKLSPDDWRILPAPTWLGDTCLFKPTATRACS